MRVSSPSMATELMRGAAEAGAEVRDLGLVGTEMVYFAVGDLGLDGGIMVTASHNPKEYTGMKIVRRGALPVGGESGLLEVRDRAVELVAVSNNLPSQRRGSGEDEQVADSNYVSSRRGEIGRASCRERVALTAGG